MNCFFCDKTVTGTDQKLSAKGTVGGWRHSVNGLVPTGTNAPPAPSNILKMIFYSCTKGCSATYSCEKVGIFCDNVCVCKDGCLNSESTEDEDEEVLCFFLTIKS